MDNENDQDWMVQLTRALFELQRLYAHKNRPSRTPPIPPSAEEARRSRPRFLSEPDS